MVRVLPALIALVCTAGCASRTVRVEVAATPAVQIRATRVAVVAQDRECRPQANALIESLGRRASIAVDPRSDVRLLVFGCGLDVGWTLTEETDATGGRAITHRRAEIAGRGHAAIAVSTSDGTLAHLVGSARAGHLGSRGVDDMFRNRKAIQQRLVADVADDLVAQLNPLPHQLERRVYPNASEGSARALYTLAVAAEQRGDLAEAVRLARAAQHERPTARRASYLQSLERRVPSPIPAD